MRTRGLILLTVASGLLVMSSWACAGQLDLIIGSKHSTDGYWDNGTQQEWNETNPGLAYTFDNGIYIGMYNNSYKHLSVTAGYAVETKYKYFNAGITGGLVTGYDRVSDYPAILMVMPYVLIGPKPFRVKIGVIPGIDVQVLTLGLNINY